jgi:hypothetical protein
MLEACGLPGGTVPGARSSATTGPTIPCWSGSTSPSHASVTFSRSQGSADRSALERYDHEHQFRVQVARRALERRGHEDDPPPLVVAIGHSRVPDMPVGARCAWTRCRRRDAVRELRGKLGVREYLALR